MTYPRFDRLAPHYWWVEAATFGGLLHWCRTALLSEVADARRVLILGEGDGRFLADFLKANAVATVDVVEAGAEMVRIAQQRIGATDRVRFHVRDARTFESGEFYDLVVTNFFLDCFPAAELDEMVDKLAARLRPRGRWLVGDFATPESGIIRLPARMVLAVMYACFRLETRIPAGELIDPAPLLRRRGFELRCEKRRLGGFLSATLWQREQRPATAVAGLINP